MTLIKNFSNMLILTVLNIGRNWQWIEVARNMLFSKILKIVYQKKKKNFNILNFKNLLLIIKYMVLSDIKT